MIHFNSVEFDTILLEDRNGHTLVSRRVTSVYGIPFYCSTGINSQYSGTWFPFFGVADTPYFIKALHDDGTLPKRFNELFRPYHSYQALNRDLPARFRSLGCLLLSSCFGGGIWDTTEGSLLDEYLRKKYSDFYANWPNMLLNDPEKTYNLKNATKMNAWLEAKAGVSHIRDLMNFAHSNVEDLFYLQARAQHLQHVPDTKSCCLVL
ncbi:MAG: hypothetical protein AB7V32_00245 [Candidatus Berkiella sp.]